jgi:UrcA family protein
MLGRIPLLAASSLIGITLGSIHVPSSPEMGSGVIPYGDLNIATTAGTQALLDRVRRVARVVCRSEMEDPFNIFKSQEDIADARSCEGKAVSDAVGRLDNPTVSDIYGRQQLLRVARIDRPGG